MKKIFGMMLCSLMLLVYVYPARALTNYKSEDYKEQYHETGSGKGTITPDKDNPNILNLKGSDGSNDFAGMKNGPYIKTNAKLSDKGGIHEVIYVDHSTLKTTDILQVEYRLYKDGKYANQIDTYAQVGYDDKINLSLTAGNFSVQLPDNKGVYKYEFKAYPEGNDVYVEFNVYDSKNNLVGGKGTGKLKLNEVFNYKNVNVTASDNVTLDAIWFTNIKATDGINVYNVADAQLATEGNVNVVDGQKVQDVLNKALQNSTYANQTKFENATVDIEMSDSVEKSEDITKIKNSINDVLKNAKVSNFFDLSIAVKDGEGTLLGNLHELSEKISLEVAIPEELKNVQSGYERKYYVVRYHDGKTEALETNVTKNGSALTFKTDKFSTYAIAYVDNKIETVPNTIDNVVTYLLIGGISLLVVSGIVIYIKKKKLFN